MRACWRDGGHPVAAPRGGYPSWVAAALLYAVLSLLMVSPGLLPGRTLSPADALWDAAPWRASRPADVPALGSNRELGDQAKVFLPFQQHTRRTLPHVPLWNTAIMGGRPFLANAQSGVFSPFNVPAYILPFWHSQAVIAALKLFVAAVGTYLLGRALRLNFAGALLAGVGFGFSFWLVAWLSWPLSSVWAFLPWLWLCADRLARTPDLVAVGALAGVVALQYVGGHPESSFHVLAFTTMFFLLRLLVLRPSIGRGVRASALRCSGFAAAMLLGAALAALTLIPLLELVRNSGDVAHRGQAGELHTPGHYLLGLFLNDYWGRSTRTPLDFGRTQAAHAFYVGALTLMLAVAALLRPSLERAGTALLGAVSVAVAVGAPPLSTVAAALPGFSLAQNTRLPVVLALCLALLAGWGLHDLMGAGHPVTRRRTVGAVAAAVLAAPVVWLVAARRLPSSAVAWEGMRVAWGFAAPREPDFGATATDFARIADEIRMGALLEWLVLATAGLVLVLLRLKGRLRPAIFAGLAVALISADLLKAGIGFNPAIPVRNAVQPVTPALRYLQDRRPNRFAGLNPTSPLSPVVPLPPDVALRYGLLDARGYDFPIEDRYLRLWRREVAPGCNLLFCTTGTTATPGALRVLSLLSVADLVQQPADPVLSAPGMHIGYEGPDARIYTNDRALPRVFTVDRQLVVDSADRALLAVTSPRIALRQVAVTEQRISGVREGEVSTRPASRDHVRLASYDAERVVVRTTTTRTSILVLTDTWFPGWQATVDGDSAPIHRVDYVLRGVRIAGGSHVVEFRYRPTSWRIGWVVSAGALLVLISILGRAAARRRS